jgi:hypothetical protein
MTQYASTFSAVGASSVLSVSQNGTIDLVITSSDWTTNRVKLQRKVGSAWQDIETFSANFNFPGYDVGKQKGKYRLYCSAYSASISYTLRNHLNNVKSIVINAGTLGKAGTTAGWVVKAASNIDLATVPASQTASTLVVPIPELKRGNRIVGFSLIGQIESAGNAVTLDADLRKESAVAADVADASVGTMTQVSVTADTALTTTNTQKDLTTDELVEDGENFYMKLTATTGASTDIALQSIVIDYQEE